MNILWVIVGWLAITGFAAVFFMVLVDLFLSHQFLRILSSSHNELGNSHILFQRPRWRANMAFGPYIITKQYERENDEKLIVAGSRLRHLYFIAIPTAILTFGLLVAFFVAIS